MKEGLARRPEGVSQRKETINLGVANRWSIALFAIAAVVGLPYFWFVARAMGHEVNGNTIAAIFKGNAGDAWWMPLAWMLVYIVVLLLGAAFHEFVHGITWAHYCKKGWRSISFGVIWKAMAPYCHCSEPLKKRQYMTGALMPLFIVGILPLLLSPFIPSFGLCIFGIIYIAGASGDLMVVWKLRKENPANAILDHPTEAGYLVYEEE